MKLIVGLGNPGKQYEHTRHNVGFRIVDRLATLWGWRWTEHRGRAIQASGIVGNEKVVLIKPLTFMNLSGEAVGELTHWYKVSPEDLLVIYDDLDLPTGKVRLRARGSAGGHNGLKDIIARLHTSDFPRLRVGIGRPQNSRMQGRDYVLSVAGGDDEIVLSSGEDRTIEAVQMFLEQGIEYTMNTINTDPEEAARKAEARALKLLAREERLKRDAQNDEVDNPVTQD